MTHTPSTCPVRAVDEDDEDWFERLIEWESNTMQGVFRNTLIQMRAALGEYYEDCLAHMEYVFHNALDDMA